MTSKRSLVLCATAEGSSREGSDAASILMVGGARPPPAVATHGRQTADSAVELTLTAPTRTAGVVEGSYNKTARSG